MAPVRALLGVVVACLVLGLARAQACDRDIDLEGDVYFEKLTHFSDAVVRGQVESVGSDGQVSIKLQCIYKTDGSRETTDITVTQTGNCPQSQLEEGMDYVMFLEKATSGGYVLRYSPIEGDFISEVITVCGIELTDLTGGTDVCPTPEPPGSCIAYHIPTKAATPEPKATPTPEPENTGGDVNVVVGGQDATPEPEGDGGANGATTNFLSCALSLLSFVMLLLVL